MRDFVVVPPFAKNPTVTRAPTIDLRGPLIAGLPTGGLGNQRRLSEFSCNFQTWS
jgi:hypothetical protein